MDEPDEGLVRALSKGGLPFFVSLFITLYTLILLRINVFKYWSECRTSSIKPKWNASPANHDFPFATSSRFANNRFLYTWSLKHSWTSDKMSNCLFTESESILPSGVSGALSGPFVWCLYVRIIKLCFQSLLESLGYYLPLVRTRPSIPNLARALWTLITIKNKGKRNIHRTK